jgi:hypothetical protein
MLYRLRCVMKSDNHRVACREKIKTEYHTRRRDTNITWASDIHWCTNDWMAVVPTQLRGPVSPGRRSARSIWDFHSTTLVQSIRRTGEAGINSNLGGHMEWTDAWPSVISLGLGGKEWRGEPQESNPGFLSNNDKRTGRGAKSGLGRRLCFK